MALVYNVVVVCCKVAFLNRLCGGCVCQATERFCKAAANSYFHYQNVQWVSIKSQNIVRNMLHSNFWFCVCPAVKGRKMLFWVHCHSKPEKLTFERMVSVHFCHVFTKQTGGNYSKKLTIHFPLVHQSVYQLQRTGWLCNSFWNYQHNHMQILEIFCFH